jgi:hypothetical protein
VPQKLREESCKTVGTGEVGAYVCRWVGAVVVESSSVLLECGRGGERGETKKASWDLN